MSTIHTNTIVAVISRSSDRSPIPNSLSFFFLYSLQYIQFISPMYNRHTIRISFVYSIPYSLSISLWFWFMYLSTIHIPTPYPINIPNTIITIIIPCCVIVIRVHLDCEPKRIIVSAYPLKFPNCLGLF